MSLLLSLEDKRDLILASEKRLAGAVAQEVVDRPILAGWMILIPIFFVFYYFQLKRYKSGLKEFQRNFMITRERALDAAYAVIASGGIVDFDGLIEVSDSPELVRPEYQDWVMALVEYYRVLLQAEGDSFDELVRGSHKKKSNYLLGVNKLNQAERTFAKALLPHLPGDAESISHVVLKMESCIENYRRDQAAEIFS
jgi:hypothetical protein